MDWKYTLSEPVLDAAELSSVADCIESGWISMGPRTLEFESRFAEQVGAKHAIAVSNGTAALHLAMSAIGVGANKQDEVIQPSINFVAGANMTRALGAQPVFADIVSLQEPTIDPDAIAASISQRTRAIMVMHYGGYPARMRQILEICEREGLPLIEDACHGPLQRVPDIPGKCLGTLGLVGCFSFFSNKNMTTAEGGMITTNSDELAEKLRKMRSHGMTTLTWDRHHGRPSTYDVLMHGYNYRIDDIRSSLGCAQLARLPDINERRRALAARYAEEVATRARPEISYIFGDSPRDGAAHVAGIVVPASCRDAVRIGLADAGIQSSLHYPPIHGFTAFAGTHTAELPLSEEFANRMVTLPLHPALPDEAPGEIIDIVADQVDRHA